MGWDYIDLAFLNKIDELRVVTFFVNVRTFKILFHLHVTVNILERSLLALGEHGKMPEVSDLIVLLMLFELFQNLIIVFFGEIGKVGLCGPRDHA